MTIPIKSFDDKVYFHAPRLDLVDMKNYHRGSIIISPLRTKDSKDARKLASDILEACDEYDRINKEYGV